MKLVHVTGGIAVREDDLLDVDNRVATYFSSVNITTPNAKQTKQIAIDAGEVRLALRHALWPGESAKTLVSPTGSGGKSYPIFHSARIHAACGKYKTAFRKQFILY